MLAVCVAIGLNAAHQTPNSLEGVREGLAVRMHRSLASIEHYRQRAIQNGLPHKQTILDSLASQERTLLKMYKKLGISVPSKKELVKYTPSGLTKYMTPKELDILLHKAKEAAKQ